ncbi:SDR family NAD(P)-dependent oxidoreductase [Novipirellula artificiosorum]|uniref:General stress protein 39 n=1 Tax=Novipirellula artificiosorum TaxID=2528016 RepID=A0A5C6E5E2_9BACT|nr:SDR family oxidoreductase [Novipirellula artificiosorum]TWU42369.1 General stress protein 39 [Novipirellula artificiosorum]
MRLANQTIVIIGGTGGIGRSASLACLQEGANLVVVGRQQQSIAAAQRCFDDHHVSDKVWVLDGDAAESATAEHAVQEAVRVFGRLDALYHVAGGSGRKFGDGPLHELTDEGIDFTLRLNLASVLYSNRAATKQFLAQGDGGSVVNLSSVLANHPSPRYFSTITYAATKAGIIGLTRSAASAYATNNIRFNVIAPGLVDTPMATRAVGNEAISEFACRKQPLDGGRVGKPTDMDGAAVFLLSNESKFVTGQVIEVDGGWSVTEGNLPE